MEITERENHSSSFEQMHQGEILSKTEEFTEKITTFHESPDGEITRKTVTREGVMETCEEEGLES